MDHEIYYDDLPVMSHGYVFTCPTSGKQVRFSPKMAAEESPRPEQTWIHVQEWVPPSPPRGGGDRPK
jgi:hypothetical protein